MPGNHQILIGGNHPHGAGTMVCGLAWLFMDIPQAISAASPKKLTDGIRIETSFYAHEGKRIGANAPFHDYKQKAKGGFPRHKIGTRIEEPGPCYYSLSHAY